MSERYHVRVRKDYLIFSCAHFITYEGDKCEPLHGHNWRTAVEVEADLDENQYVFDFIALKKLAKRFVDEWDHHMLLQTESRLIRVEETGKQVRVTFEGREWVFPRADCVLLPIANTTAELLAKHLAGRLREALKGEHHFEPAAIRVEVEENDGQAATYEWRRG